MTSIDKSVQSPLDVTVIIASDITDKVTAPATIDVPNDVPNDFEMPELQMKSSVKGKKRPNDVAVDDDGVQASRAKKSRGRPVKSSTHGRRTRARVLSEGNVCAVSAAGVLSAGKSVGRDEGTQTEILMQPEMSEMLPHDVAWSDTVMTCITALLTPISSHVHSLQKEMENIKAAVEQLSSSISQLAHSDNHESHETHNSSIDTDSSSSCSVSDDDVNGGFVASSAATKKRQKKAERNERRRQSRDVMTKQSQSQPSVEMSRDVVASMYVDIELKQRRAKNIVMSGVPHSNDDFTYVTNLLAEEFNWHYIPTTSCRRIGRQVDTRVQPLLVTLECREDASYLVANARQLRESLDPAVRHNVYISADLTPAEAKAAYEIRCRRRESTQRGRDQHSSNNPTAGTSGISAGSADRGLNNGRH